MNDNIDDEAVVATYMLPRIRRKKEKATKNRLGTTLDNAKVRFMLLCQ